jgi:hypothetical protein
VLVGLRLYQVVGTQEFTKGKEVGECLKSFAVEE